MTLAVVLVDWANVARAIRTSADADSALERVVTAAHRHVASDSPQIDEVEVRLYSGWDHEDAAFVNRDLAMIEAALGSGAYDRKIDRRRYRMTVARNLILGGPALKGTLRQTKLLRCPRCSTRLDRTRCPSCSANIFAKKMEQKMVDTAIVADAVAAVRIANAVYLFSNDKDLLPGLLTARSLGITKSVWVRQTTLHPGNQSVDAPAIMRHITVKADPAIWN